MDPTARRRLVSLARHVVWEAALPLAVTVGIVGFLADPDHIETSELRANSLLMRARPIFRTVAPGDELRVALGDSAILLGAAVLGALLFAVPAAIAYSASRDGPAKAAVWALGTLAASLPAFFWAIVLGLASVLVSLQTGLPFLPVAGFGIDEHLILPAVALGLRPAAYIFRFSAISIEEVRHADFVRTGIAKGLRDREVLVHHILPNAAPGIVAAILLATRMALSSLVIVEYVYIWGGAGTLFLQALGLRRLELATGLALSFAVGSALLAAIASAARSRGPLGHR